MFTCTCYIYLKTVSTSISLVRRAFKMSVQTVKCLFFIIAFNIVTALEKSSLTFVIDDTGSMTNDINAVRESVNDIFDTVMKSNVSQIEDFVIVTFNDPGVKHLITTTDKDSFKKAVASIDVHGGGDCPEMAMNGIKLALEKSKPESLVYVFTDASAKDPGQHDAVKQLAHKKQIQVVFVLTDHCSDGDEKVYYNVADETDGQVFHLSKSEVPKILRYVRTQINSRKTTIARKKFPPGTHNFSYEVDSKMKELVISVSGDNPSIKVTDPEGEHPTTEEIMKTSSVAIVKVKEVKPGIYTAEVSSTSDSTVVVKADTILHFKHGYSPFEATSIDDTVTRPIPGEKSHLSIKLTTEDDSYINLITAQILNMENEVLIEKPLKPVNMKDNFYTTDAFVSPDHIFKIAIKGQDPVTGAIITRISLTPIEPQTFDKSTPNKAPEVTIVGSNKVNADYDKPLTLKCKITAIPKPNVVWETSDGTKIPSKLSLIELPGHYLSILELDLITTNNTYTCKANNEIGKDSKPIDVVTVNNEYFTILSKPMSAEIKLDNEARFECKIDANPPAEIKWYKRNVPLESSGDENLHFSKDNSVLTIKRMRPKNADRYSCVASNIKVKETFSFLVEITGVEKPELDKTITEVRAKEGSDVSIKCKILKGKPTPRLYWYFIHWSDHSETEIDETEEEIYIDDVNQDFAGTYRCEARNGVGEDYHNIALLLDHAPVISRVPSIISTKEGAKVKLPCVVSGEPTPTVKWFLNGTEIDISLTSRYRYYRNILSFKASKHDFGTYVCEATNIHGSVKVTMKLNVNNPPTIEPPKESVIDVKVGDHVSLPCIADGNPKPEISWIFFSYDRKIRPQRLRATKKLFLPRVQVDREGYYTCVAKNVGGATNITYEVRVFAPPSIENVHSEKTFKAVIGDVTLKIPCKARGNPKPEITWTQGGTFNVAAGSEWFDIDEFGTLIIKNVDKESGGIYACEARNVMGFDTETYEVVVETSPPTGPATLTIKIEEGHPETLQCNIRHEKTDSVRWFKDGVLLSTNPDYEIRSARYNESGIYTCRVSNFARSVSGHIKVIVGLKPRFLYDEEHDIDYVYGEDAYMDCSAEGYPVPKVSWWHEGHELPVKSMTLILNMKPKDRGLYYCVAVNEFGHIIRELDIKTRDCLINIESDLIGNQPLIVSPDLNWPVLNTYNGYINIPTGHHIKLYCPNRFRNFKTVEILATCEREANFKYEGRTHKFLDFHCKETVTPIARRTGEMCLPSKRNSELVKIGYAMRKNFLEVYSVCLDTNERVPFYTEHKMQNYLSDMEPKIDEWFENDLVPFNYDKLYNCDAQTKTISHVLRRLFHTDDKCCFAKRQLVNPRDVLPGLSQIATYSNLNVVAHWSTCNTKNWNNVEKRVRALAKSSVDGLHVWTGTAHQLQISGLNIKLDDSEGRLQTVPKYLWKVIQDPKTKSSLAIVQLNIPDMNLADSFRHVVCRDVCNDIPWLRSSSTKPSWRDARKGYTYCCGIEEFERAFGYEGLFGKGPRKLLHEVALLPDVSLVV